MEFLEFMLSANCPRILEDEDGTGKLIDQPHLADR